MALTHIAKVYNPSSHVSGCISNIHNLHLQRYLELFQHNQEMKIKKKRANTEIDGNIMEDW